MLRRSCACCACSLVSILVTWTSLDMAAVRWLLGRHTFSDHFSRISAKLYRPAWPDSPGGCTHAGCQHGQASRHHSSYGSVQVTGSAACLLALQGADLIT